MGLIDTVVNRAFTDTPAERVVVFSGDPRKCGYSVRSIDEEQKIKSFLKMFCIAHVCILVFGTMLAQGWASWLAHASFARPAHNLPRSLLIAVAMYGLVVGLPYALLWGAYKRALLAFTDPADEIPLTAVGAPNRPWVLLAVVGFAVLILAAILMLLVSPKVP